MSKWKNLKVNTICFLFICFAALLCSCQEKEDHTLKKFKGDWAIEEISYQGNDYFDNLYENTLFLKEENKITLPETVDSKVEKAVWKVVKEGEKSMLEINSKNAVFNGRYHFRFIKNYEKKLLGIELKSDKTHIIAYKFLQNFEIDGKWW